MNQSSQPKLSEIVGDQLNHVVRVLEIQLSGDIPASESYLHWDDLTESGTPPLLNLREWWLALKLSRVPGRVPAGFKDIQGHSFSLVPSETFAPILHPLDRGPDVNGLPESVHPGGVWHDYFSSRAQVDEAVASARMAGARVSDETARDMLLAGRRPRDEDERVVRNIHDALEFLRAAAAQPLSLGLLSELHERLLSGAGLRPGAAGRLRRRGETPATPATEAVPAGEPPPAAELPARVKALLAFANARAPSAFVHPMCRACVLHYWVAHDRPFAAGNGRMARLLFRWAVLHYEYTALDAVSLSRQIADSPAALARAFSRVATDENDLNYVIAHHLAALVRGLRRLREDALAHEAAVADAAARTRVLAPGLNPRQHALLAVALRAPAARHTLQSHARAHRLVRQTARHDFEPLTRLGFFEETKSGKALLYQPAPGFAARLGAPAPA